MPFLRHAGIRLCFGRLASPSALQKIKNDAVLERAAFGVVDIFHISIPRHVDGPTPRREIRASPHRPVENITALPRKNVAQKIKWPPAEIKIAISRRPPTDNAQLHAPMRFVFCRHVD